MCDKTVKMQQPPPPPGAGGQPQQFPRGHHHHSPHPHMHQPPPHSLPNQVSVGAPQVSVGQSSQPGGIRFIYMSQPGHSEVAQGQPGSNPGQQVFMQPNTANNFMVICNFSWFSIRIFMTVNCAFIKQNLPFPNYF